MRTCVIFVHWFIIKATLRGRSWPENMLSRCRPSLPFLESFNYPQFHINMVPNLVVNDDIWMKVCFYTGLLVPLPFSFPINLTRIHDVKFYPYTRCSLDRFCEVLTLFVAKWVSNHSFSYLCIIPEIYRLLPQFFHNDSNHRL